MLEFQSNLAQENHFCPSEHSCGWRLIRPAQSIYYSVTERQKLYIDAPSIASVRQFDHCAVQTLPLLPAIGRNRSSFRAVGWNGFRKEDGLPPLPTITLLFPAATFRAHWSRGPYPPGRECLLWRARLWYNNNSLFALPLIDRAPQAGPSWPAFYCPSILHQKPLVLLAAMPNITNL